MNVDWKVKLSSRKLWLGVALVILGTILCFTGDTANGMILISTGGLGYLGSEMLVDVFRIVFSCSLFNDQVEQDRSEAVSENATATVEGKE